MHPAFSVIFLTTLIGVGQGLFLALYLGASYAAFGLVPDQDARSFQALGSLLSLLFLAAGLAASFLHLGRPERAWRAATQWRTSWLSREVIALPAFMALVALYGAAQWLGWQSLAFAVPGGYAINVTLLLGALATVACFALFVCTG